VARSAAYLELCKELKLEDLHGVTLKVEDIGYRKIITIEHPDRSPELIIDFDRMDRITKLAGSISVNDFPSDEDLAEEALWQH
jgi:hypothetical protein